MKPNGGGVATGKVAALIDKQFGSYDKFRAEFVAAGNYWNILAPVRVCGHQTDENCLTSTYLLTYEG